ncbi:LutC/YkgG family protein [Sediminibacterium ginsengisoli]|uniref:L-lactate dehydrogenase complex protein LldG n=1 Tax=Sediminibacterium ginsengisoli TaxID=413434 RepID=A0A1T4KX74_9BACT|nr:LUD domain-containing protein [Sediminibacterium ginsengisoli]SJZ46917.1 L-lactate dehydrogenase complex protein LldG [Sediminibacterium ginsengisoli]
MSSRDEILSMIRENRPAFSPLPEIPVFIHEKPLAEWFTETLTGIGGKVVHLKDTGEVETRIQQQHGGVINTTDLSAAAKYRHATAQELEAVDTVIVPGIIAVAENAAVWVNEKDMINRLLPFICRQLIIIVQLTDLVPDMHSAYKKIRIDEAGFGVFIAGPSKTADIEQSLVIGAHGPLAMEVWFVGE